MTKVLIVEDDEALRNVFSLIIKSAGHKVTAARDGEDGLKQLKSFSPDIVLLDMLMPVKTGLEFLQEADIKKNYPDTTVILLSNLSESHTIEEGLNLGAAKHVIKSNILPNDLIAIIEKYTTPPKSKK